MIAESLRREPLTAEEWLGPLPVPDWFAHPERPLEVDLGSGKGPKEVLEKLREERAILHKNWKMKELERQGGKRW